MKASLLSALALLGAVAAIPNPGTGNNGKGNNKTPHTPNSHASNRPNVHAHPHQCKKPSPNPPNRNGKTCTVQTYGDGSDDSALVMSALQKCNSGGHVIFAANTTYTIGTALDLTFLKHIDLGGFMAQVYSVKADRCRPPGQDSSG